MHSESEILKNIFATSQRIIARDTKPNVYLTLADNAVGIIPLTLNSNNTLLREIIWHVGLVKNCDPDDYHAERLMLGEKIYGFVKQSDAPHSDLVSIERDPRSQSVIAAVKNYKKIIGS